MKTLLKYGIYAIAVVTSPIWVTIAIIVMLSKQLNKGV